MKKIQKRTPKAAERPTIKDVAAMAGYSIATVSLVLNNKDVSIPQSTRDKIWAAAKSLNYRPNSLAVSLITKRTGVLGLIIPDNRNLVFSALSLTIEAEARREGYALIYGNSSNVARRDLQYLETFLDRQVDGILLLMSSINDERDAKEIMRVVKNSPVPVVAVDRAVPESGLPTVQMNHKKSGYLCTKHLLELGHRRIGCFMSPGFITARIERGQGYRAALDEFGVPFDEDLLFEVSYTEGANTGIFARMQKLGATAILTVNDAGALEFYRFAREKGVRIPEDISVVGSDDSPFADLLSPPLTTVQQPLRLIGKTAVDTLLGLINKQDSGRPLLQQFDPQLVVRSSTSTR